MNVIHLFLKEKVIFKFFDRFLHRKTRYVESIFPCRRKHLFPPSKNKLILIFFILLLIIMDVNLVEKWVNCTAVVKPYQPQLTSN